MEKNLIQSSGLFSSNYVCNVIRGNNFNYFSFLSFQFDMFTFHRIGVRQIIFQLLKSSFPSRNPLVKMNLAYNFRIYCVPPTKSSA